MNQEKNKLFEEFCTKANSIKDNETLTLLVQTNNITFSVGVHKYDLNHEKWNKLFESHLESLEKLCNDFNVDYSLGSVQIYNHYHNFEVEYGKAAVTKKERERQLCMEKQKRKQ